MHGEARDRNAPRRLAYRRRSFDEPVTGERIDLVAGIVRRREIVTKPKPTQVPCNGYH